jgi:hypothetical protein
VNEYEAQQFERLASAVERIANAVERLAGYSSVPGEGAAGAVEGKVPESDPEVPPC